MEPFGRPYKTHRRTGYSRIPGVAPAYRNGRCFPGTGAYFWRSKRHPAGRVVTIAYYSLINIEHHKLNILDNELHWHDVKSVTNLAFDHQQILKPAIGVYKNAYRNTRWF